MKITIFGAGYVGLVTGACLAEAGNQVLCIDNNVSRVTQLQQGQCPIHEPDLPQLLEKNIQAGRLQFSLDAQAGIAHGDYLFIAVGTPANADGSANLNYVFTVAEEIGQHLTAERLIIIKSTVPVGTADRVKATIAATLAKRGLSVPFAVASNPEFLRQGAAIADFMQSDRIIIGTAESATAKQLEKLYTPFDRNHQRLIKMDVRSAELTKYAANAFLATKISFINEMSHLAERLGADIEQVRIGIGSDPRIGYHFIYPGCGFGGSCFPKDVSALESLAQHLGFEPHLIRAINQVNQLQKRTLFDKIHRYFAGDLHNKTIALWGLAFKPDTDDMREAPSRTLMELLWQAGATVRAFDPAAMPTAQQLYPDQPQLTLCPTAEAALVGADVLAIVTEWRVFSAPDFALIKTHLAYPAIFDGRNLYDPQHLQQLGFHYYAIGRGETLPSV